MKYKKKNSLILIAISLIVLFFLVKLLQRPIQRFTSGFYHPFFTPISKIENMTARQALMMQDKKSLVKELLKLQRINETLAAENNVLQDLKKENAELKDMLGIIQTPDYKSIFAEIYLRDPAEWYESFSLNKGSNDNIQPGCIVIARIPENRANTDYVFAVVGRITSVTPTQSQVETIISRKCRLSVILKESQAPGILDGGIVNGKNTTVKITKLPVYKNYKAHEAVITSGLNPDLTPPLLFLGYSSEKGSSPDIKKVNHLYAELNFRPAIDFDNLRYMVVLIPKITSPDD